MPVIQTSLDLNSEAARANRKAWGALKAELAERRAAVAEGGPKRARERHLARGKLLPRERVMTPPRSGRAVPRAVAARRLRHV